MNPTVYQVTQKSTGLITTVKTFNDPVGVVRGLFRVPGRYLPYVVTERNGMGGARTTMVCGDEYEVKDISGAVHLDLVKWCPAVPDGLARN